MPYFPIQSSIGLNFPIQSSEKAKALIRQNRLQWDPLGTSTPHQLTPSKMPLFDCSQMPDLIQHHGKATYRKMYLVSLPFAWSGRFVAVSNNVSLWDLIVAKLQVFPFCHYDLNSPAPKSLKQSYAFCSPTQHLSFSHRARLDTLPNRHVFFFLSREPFNNVWI